MSETTDIIMPLEQEGSKSTIRVWLKRVGEAVRRDEPLVELETDKVAVEVPSPADGVLQAIHLNEGDEAAPGAVLGVLSLGASVMPDTRNAIRNAGDQAAAHLRQSSGAEPRNDQQRETRLSPLVKRLLSEHKLDARAIAGSGRDGRITPKDIADHVARSASPPVGAGARIVPHDAMRRAIAAHMTSSVAAAPHVTAVFEADFSAIIAHRAKHKSAYADAGAPLTFSAYIVRAAADAMQAAPNVNSRWHDDALEVFEDANIGMGVALGEKGLIVPVIARAQTLSLKQIAARLGDLTERARTNRLKPADVQGGTFTISNHGVSGSLLATPIIINQPQSAILGVGKLEKRVVVREVDGADAMVIKPMAYVSLTIDHRVLDGHQTNAWLTHFVATLENWPIEDPR